MKQATIQFLAKLFAVTVNWKLLSIGLFRRIDFKGKLSASQYIRKARLPANGVYECQGMLFDIDFADGIQRDIFFNLYERRECQLIRRHIKPGDTCFDIGANVGFYATQFSTLVANSGKVHVFEPDGRNVQKLRRNLELNHLQDRVTVNQTAVSSQTGVASFSLTSPENTGWGRITSDSGIQTIEVPTVTLDDYVKANGIEKIDFMKIDIEGHEFGLFEGARNCFQRKIPRKVLIEYCGYTLDRQGRSVTEYLDFFARYGYQPIELNLDRVADARNGHARNDFATYDLLFVCSK